MNSGAKPLRLLPVLASLVALQAGCRTSEQDIHRWANTAQGPRKLVAVVTHERYPMDLRLEAATALIGMKPRGGRRVGIQGNEEHPGLVDSLTQMSPTGRSDLVSRLIPKLTAEMQKPPSAAQAGQPAAPDSTVPFKDAAFAVLTYEDGALVPDENMRKSLRNSLSRWASSNFAERMEDSSQMFGMEQVLRELKADGVRALADLIVPGAPKVDRMVELIADFGDAATKQHASEKLVTVAKEVNSEAWIKQKTPSVEAANKASRLTPTPQQFKAQIDQYQEEELLRVFSAMKKVGGKPAVDYLVGFVQDKTQSEKRRASAMAALAGNLDKNNASHAQVALAIASANETPDSLRDVALQRVGEFPRPMVVDRLYELFNHDNWKIRWVAAELVLKMSETSNLAEFFTKLAKADGMAITEPLRYGTLIAEMKGPPPPAEVASKYLDKANSVQARLTAFGYYYQVGTSAELNKIEPHAKDLTATPRCKPDAKECEWKCTIAGAKGEETKDVKNIGEFVEYCVVPAMQKRAAPKK